MYKFQKKLACWLRVPSIFYVWAQLRVQTPRLDEPSEPLLESKICYDLWDSMETCCKLSSNIKKQFVKYIFHPVAATTVLCLIFSPSTWPEFWCHNILCETATICKDGRGSCRAVLNWRAIGLNGLDPYISSPFVLCHVAMISKGRSMYGLSPRAWCRTFVPKPNFI